MNLASIPPLVLNLSTPLQGDLNPPTLVHPQQSLLDQGSSQANWIKCLSNKSPERAYLQGLVYLDKAFAWTESMEEFLVPIIDTCHKIPGFDSLRKQDVHKWCHANDIRCHYQTTPHKMEAAWKATLERWGDNIT